MTRVYADMVADLFHAGHVEFLRRASELGEELVVGVHSDAAVASYKRAPVLTMDERAAVVRACRYVDEVLLEAPIRVTKEWIDEHRLDVVVHGDDFDEATSYALYAAAIDLGIYRTVPYTSTISTSDVIERVRRRLDDGEL